MQRMIRIAVPAVVLALLSACATRPQTSNAPVYSPTRGVSGVTSATVGYGVVRSIESLGSASEQPHGGGAVVGGIVGAVIGRQFADSNSGKNVGTVAGAVGGALIGNEIEKNSRRDQQGVRVNVQLDQGGLRSFDFKSIGELRVGDRVRIDGNQLYRL
ncbi:MAG: glycine zipper 2TM domain-containing protein [Burkholderiaceae bacterium]|nr:glycine zipper 2TM domain-containing protein [Burkholderiaceae bacterium]